MGNEVDENHPISALTVENNFTVRLPRHIIENWNLKEGDTLVAEIRAGKLTISPQKPDEDVDPLDLAINGSWFTKITAEEVERISEEEQRNQHATQTSLSSFLTSNGNSDLNELKKSSKIRHETSGKVLYLLPFHFIKRIRELVEFYGSDSVAVCTGWVMTHFFTPLIRQNGIKSFPLTSHAGKDDVQRYIRESKVKRVIYC